MCALCVDVLAWRFTMTALARRDVCPPHRTGFQKVAFYRQCSTALGQLSKLLPMFWRFNLQPVTTIPQAFDHSFFIRYFSEK